MSIELQPGQHVDRYEVVRKLGQGGMAVVFEVRHRALGTRHALKVVLQRGQAVRERLLREGQLQAALRHPHVLPVTDVLEVQGAPGLLLDYVDGPTLETWLEQHRPSFADAEALFRQILDGVERAHSAGVIHRDLKPGNVLLSPNRRGGWEVRVADFGLAKALGEPGSTSHTRTGVAMGTPSYMAPEQIRDAKSVDQRADVFALGAILYELVCGAIAFPGADMLEVLNRVAAGAYAHPHEHRPELPDRIVASIQGSLEVDPLRRIPSTQTLREVLEGELPWPPPSRAGAKTYDASAWMAEGDDGAASPWPGPAAPPPGTGIRETLAPDLEPDRHTKHAEPEPSARASWKRGALGGALLALALGGLALLGFALGRLDSPDVAVQVPPEAASTGAVAESPLPVATSPDPLPVAEPTTREQPPVEPPSPKKTPTGRPREAELAPEPPTGWVAASGADEVRLVGEDGSSFSPGKVPVGTYSVRVRFGERNIAGAGVVQVTQNTRVHLRCDPDFGVCE